MSLMHAHSLLTTLFTLLFTFIHVSALPVDFSLGTVTLPVARRANFTGSSKMLRFDQARAQTFRQRGQSTSQPSPPDIDVSASDLIVAYVTPVTIGCPPTTYSLLIDTGSSNTWVKPSTNVSLTAHPTGDMVSVTYGSGTMWGMEVKDTVTLAGNLTLHDQSFAVAVKDQGFDGVDGILGVGPQALTKGSMMSNANETIPTVTDNAWNSGDLDAYKLGIFFHPHVEHSLTNGELTFGGVDDTKFTGAINYVPITDTLPASLFVGIDQEITYGSDKLVMHTTAGILDTGTTLILIASDAFATYQNLTGGQLDDKTSLLRITLEQYSNLQSLYFKIGNTRYELTPNAQIWPRSLNSAIGGDKDAIYLIVNDLGGIGGQGLDFINGMSFLERFYMVYDAGSNTAGLATTPYTYAETN